MNYPKYLKVISLVFFAISMCIVMIGCGSDDEDLTKDTNSYPQELFPNLVKETWYYFKPDTKEFTHYEQFDYEYDIEGRRIHGYFHHGGTGLNLDLTYLYDSNGKPTGEKWESVEPYPPDNEYIKWTDCNWDLTYRYDGNGKIIGGYGTGFYDWDFDYSYDAKGKRIKTQFTSTDVFAPRFTLNHEYDDAGQCIMAKGKDQDNKDIIIVYEYE